MTSKRIGRRKVTAAMRLLALSASLPLANPVSAQDASTYFTVKNAQLFKTDWTGFYRAVDAATAALRAQYPHLLNLSYGPDVKQKLDVYTPAKKHEGAPVFLFLHGGGFREGDRAQYGFIAKPFVENGIIVAVASYRLTDPGFSHPSQVEDIKLALKWLYQNVENYGGGALQLFVGGHSAGGVLSADVAVDRSWMKHAKIPREALRGMIPVSALYDLRISEPGAEKKVFWNTYAPGPAEQHAASPILHIVDPVPKALVAVGSTEHQGFEDFVTGSIEFVERLTAAGVHARFVSLAGAAHKDTALALADSSSELAQAAVAMILGGV